MKLIWESQHLSSIFPGCTQRQCEISKDIVANYRTMFESRISAGATEKIPCSENLSISSWSYDMEGHAKKCEDRYCELANKTIQQLYKVSTPCIDDHHFKEEELKSVGELSKVCSQFVFFRNACTWHVFDDPIFYGQWTNLHGRITKWTKACDKTIIFFDIVCFHLICEYKQYCHVENTAKQWRLGLFQDSDFAGDLEDSKSTLGGTLCIFGSHTFLPISWMCKKQTSVSHSSTESEIISLDAGLRLNGIPILDSWDLIVPVLHGNTHQNDQVRRDAYKSPTRKKIHGKIDDLNSVDFISSNARVGNFTECANVRCALWMMWALFSISDFGPRRLSGEACQCQVYCNRLWCDLLCNTLQGVQQARLLASRGCVRFARRPSLHWEKLQKSTLAHMCRSFDSSNPPYSYPETRIVTRRQCTTCQVSSSRLSSVPIPSIDLNLWNRSRPSAFVPISLGFTSFLTDDIVRSFRNTKSWMNKNLVWMCFILRLAPCFVATARAVLLSALACIRNDSPISFSIACAKSTQLTVHQEHTFLILHCTRQQYPVLDIHSSREIDQRNAEYKMCFSSSLGHRPSQHQNIPWCVSRSCSSHSVSMQVSSGRDSVHVFLTNISALSWNVSNLHVLVTQVCMTSILSQTSDLVSLRLCIAVFQQQLWIMNVELDHTLSSRRADSNSSVPSKESSLPLRSAVEQCPGIRPRTWQ